MKTGVVCTLMLLSSCRLTSSTDAGTAPTEEQAKVDREVAALTAKMSRARQSVVADAGSGDAKSR